MRVTQADKEKEIKDLRDFFSTKEFYNYIIYNLKWMRNGNIVGKQKVREDSQYDINSTLQFPSSSSWIHYESLHWKSFSVEADSLSNLV